MMSRCDAVVSLDNSGSYSELGYIIGEWRLLRRVSRFLSRLKWGQRLRKYVRRQGNSTARSEESDGGEPDKKGSWHMWHSWAFSGSLWESSVGWAERNV